MTSIKKCKQIQIFFFLAELRRYKIVFPYYCFLTEQAPCTNIILKDARGENKESSAEVQCRRSRSRNTAQLPCSPTSGSTRMLQTPFSLWSWIDQLWHCSTHFKETESIHRLWGKVSKIPNMSYLRIFALSPCIVRVRSDGWQHV